ncbi:endonuclease VII domain-containing protein [Sphaerisporangium sp. NPDC049002]|uniref:endonuclease VII domain-containing protein n=1 Tax=Sphaerisporangium sp. NPDC049002 TaxID=3155392 RepID=UPI0033CA4F35
MLHTSAMARADDYDTCARGHPWGEENTGPKVGGGRFCRTCARESQAIYRARRAGLPEPPRSPLVKRELYPGGLKRCCVCGEMKDVEEYPLQGVRYRRGRCRACSVAAAAAWAEANPERARSNRIRGELRRKYEITPEDYTRILEEQGGRCKICGARTSVGKGEKLYVDHKPGTRIVRGLLCNHCNGGLAMFRDDPARLRAAAAYMRRWSR